MADTATTRAAIVALMQTLDIGVVHAFEPYANSKTDLKKLYVRDGLLRGWFVRRLRTREESQDLGRWTDVTRWKIHGYRALVEDDNSEQQFDNEIELIRTAVRDDDTLGGAVDSCIVGNEAGIVLVDFQPVLFAGVLCHSADLALNTRVYR